MTTEETKQKVLDTWLDQTAKYATGPVVGERYCTDDSCYLCHSLKCPSCPLYQKNIGCETHVTLIKLKVEVSKSSVTDPYLYGVITAITTELTAAMALRHRFYVRAYDEVLKDAPVEQFVSGEGFPELLKFDRELVKKMEIT